MTTIDTDVVVVGAGGAGLCAAIEAARLGKQVELLEKNERPGGTTVWSIGSLTASGSPLQVAAGISDSPQAHFEDMAKFLGPQFPPDNLELRRVLVENVPETLRQLMAMGLVFFGPTAEPPHRMPRMHNVLPSSRAYGHYLLKEARRLGVRIHLRTRGQRLITTGETVTGVVAGLPGGQHVNFRSRRGVVLAAGDFSGSVEMKRLHLPEVAEVPAIVPTSTGDGHQLGLSVGGVVVNGALLDGPQMRFVPPPASVLRDLPPNRFISRVVQLALSNLPARLLRPVLMAFITTLLQRTAVCSSMARCL